jgi:DNA-binding SARP family transcriptional activator
MQTVLRVYLLGSLDLHQAGGEARSTIALQKPPTLKSQSLLAYLILRRNEIVPRGRLLEMFWGEYPERRARQSLSTALWHIRRCFSGAESIQGDNYSVQFTWKPVWVDATEFEAHTIQGDLPNLEAALALYRGDFLESFYDDWIIDERYRLEERYLKSLALLMDIYEEGRRFADALTAAQRLLAKNPLREDAHRMAMRAYCGLGQRNAALEQFYTCRQSIRDELGIEPLPETEALFRAIQEGEIEIGSPQTQPASSILVQKSAGRDPNDTAILFPLMGRDLELKQLYSLWERTRRGERCLLLIGGDVGVGKTRLVDAFANQVRGWGNRVLWGRCYEFERLLPYQPIAEALRSLAAR